MDIKEQIAKCYCVKCEQRIEDDGTECEGCIEREYYREAIEAIPELSALLKIYEQAGSLEALEQALALYNLTGMDEADIREINKKWVEVMMLSKGDLSRIVVKEKRQGMPRATYGVKVFGERNDGYREGQVNMQRSIRRANFVKVKP